MAHSRMRSPLLLLALLAGTPPARALTEECAGAVTNMIGRTIEEGDWHLPGEEPWIDVEWYRPHQRILALADGDGSADHFSIGERVHQAFPDKDVFLTDYLLKHESHEGRLRRLRVDARETLPFPDRAFDAIVMRRGLCACQRVYDPTDLSLCAGFCPTGAETKRFLSEIARVLNTRHPAAVAVLHGHYGVTADMKELWRQAGLEVERRYPVKVTVQTNRYGDFNSIVVRPRAVTPQADSH